MIIMSASNVEHDSTISDIDMDFCEESDFQGSDTRDSDSHSGDPDSFEQIQPHAKKQKTQTHRQSPVLQKSKNSSRTPKMFKDRPTKRTSGSPNLASLHFTQRSQACNRSATVTPPHSSRAPPTPEPSVADGGTFQRRLEVVEKCVKRIEKNQEEFLLLQKQILSQLSSACSGGKARVNKQSRIRVSSFVRTAVHDAYTSGEETGLTWTLSKDNAVMKPQSEENQAMTRHVHSVVKGMYPDTGEAVLKAATERYFQSLKEKEQKEKSGKLTTFNKKMVLYQRRKRKLVNRVAALEKKSSWSEELKAKVRDCLQIEYMSSEYEEESDDETIYVIRPIPWRSQEYNGYIKELDRKSSLQKSKAAKRQTAKRVYGRIPSDRPCPERAESCDWAVVTQ